MSSKKSIPEATAKSKRRDNPRKNINGMANGKNPDRK
jgi:hypothetical protein